MPLMRTNFTAADHTRLWEHFNSQAVLANPELYYSGTYNLATSGGTLNGGTAAWGGTAWISRGPHGRVHFDAILTVQSGGAFVGVALNGTAPIGIPTGYRPMTKGYETALGVARLVGPQRNAFVTWDVATSRLKLQVEGTSSNWAAGHRIGMSLSWVSDESVPSSTPGVLVSGV